MSNIKMRDVFNRVEYVNGREIDTGELVDSCGGWWATFNSKQSAMHAATAINQHDKLVEQVEKLTRALQMISDLGREGSHVVNIANHALEETC